MHRKQSLSTNFTTDTRHVANIRLMGAAFYFNRTSLFIPWRNAKCRGPTMTSWTFTTTVQRTTTWSLTKLHPTRTDAGYCYEGNILYTLIWLSCWICYALNWDPLVDENRIQTGELSIPFWYAMVWLRIVRSLFSSLF